MRFRSIALFTALSAATLLADVKLPAIMSDHMALQAGVPVRIFGWAAPGESVTVQFLGQTVTAMTGSGGKWQAWLMPLKAGDAGDMSIRGQNSLTISDVIAGEVWVGSGQSNMQWTVKRSVNSDQEIANAKWPKIRLFRVPLKTTATPQEDVEAKWEVCSPDSIGEFSAVLYFFGRELHKKMNVPFGLIQSAYGGTPAQAWTSMEALNADPALVPLMGEWNKILQDYPEATARYRKAMSEWEATPAGERKAKPGLPQGPGHQNQPAGLFNAMINPILPYTIKGAIWYQGESNATKTQAPLYKRLMETMILDWRARWGVGDFPFFWVQLANFAKAGSPADWVIVQEAQTKTMELRNTGQIVINDIGTPEDIHPPNKQDVGARLALVARHVTYHEDNVYSGPRFRTATTESATGGDRGNRLRLWFDSVGGGLQARGSGPLKGFEVAGPDRTWTPADAVVDGKTIVVSSPTVTNPVAVRYAWASNPDCNLINAEGLPAGVFRWGQE